MNINRVLKLNGTLLDKSQLEKHLEKIAANHNVELKSKKETYPVPIMKQNFQFIKETYNLLNEHVKLGINIHPAGEWLLDNFYIIEETVNLIEKELTLKKYTEFLGIANGNYKGFARVYVLASEIVAYTEGKIEKDDLEKYIESYQTKRTLNMDEIWNIGLFLQVAIINNIKEVCEKIYNSQIQKYKVENIAERLIENKEKTEQKFKNQKNNTTRVFQDMSYSFIEYMAYTLKRYGKKGYSYLKVLEETVEMAGSTVQEVIKKEHFDIAVKKVLMGNYITSIKTIQRIDFLEIFQKLNGVEEILNMDLAKCYPKMDHTSKAYYRNKIKEISKKIKVSEIYIAKKILEITQKKSEEYKKENKEKSLNLSMQKQLHIGYYLIGEGINELYNELNYTSYKKKSNSSKTKIYIFGIIFLSFLTSIGLTALIHLKSTILQIISFIVLLIPSSEIIVQLAQYLLNKMVKPKLIPKMDFLGGIDNKNACIVVIPTILKNKEKVIELMKKLEVFYIANKSQNLYFALLGDCLESSVKEEKFDNEVVEEGLKQVKKLNDKYSKNNEPIFYFLYRNRTWNESEGKYLGWERKRGLLNQFNEYLIEKMNMQKNSQNSVALHLKENLKENTKINFQKEAKNEAFKINTFENIDQIPNIKYVITLDADTDLILDSAFELVGAMAHILNKPIIDKEKNVVIDGYGIIQPRVGVNLDISYKNYFTKIFAGAGGIDSYTNAISDIYQDNFEEGIFTGKGIYDLQTFETVMKNTIPENTVLSHDLLEGNYLRCGLASDIMLMDGYPTKYLSFMARLSRWIRGDWQIAKWLKQYLKQEYLQEKQIENKQEKNGGKVRNPLNLLSKYKILDNLRRSLLEISVIFAFVYLTVLQILFNKEVWGLQIILGLIVIIPFILEFLNLIILKKEGEKKQKDFSPRVTGVKGAFLRLILTAGCLPYKAYESLKAIIKTIYRCKVSKKHLLEWTTSEEAEKQSKGNIFSYYKQMYINIIFGIILFLIYKNAFFLSVLWFITPFIMCKISKQEKQKSNLEKLNKEQKEYVLDTAKRTWQFFEDYLNEENNYLIIDNYQEDRKNKTVPRTSSTNIGLSMLAVIAGYDLEFIPLEKCLFLLEKIIQTIDSLEKWNGHLYNWYDTETKIPLNPRYVSTVDSGNLVGYLYVVKAFLEKIVENKELQNKKVRNNIEIKDKKEEIEENNNKIKMLIQILNKIIENTDFSKLYEQEHQIFSIGFNIEENKLTNSYYDLMASEARQASLVAIAKKDVPTKHWNSLSRTITTLNGYGGLLSWSGTAFEYLMPNINIPKYEGSFLDESCKFLIMSQKEYAKKLKIPWGISESAFNLKDLQSNYQYKAFGIPWLGLKRGLADEFVVSSYGSILAINDETIDVIKNMQLLEQYGMRGKYGFYESIDFTPERVPKNKKASVVKTYMAHHQGLILLSINNLFKNNIFQKRFMQNPEMEAVSILLQERKPEKYIVAKKDKEKIEKLKYKDYESYTINTYTKIDEKLITGNVISNENYTVAISQKGEGFSKYKDIYINRFKPTEDYSQGIFFYIKNIKTKEIITTNYALNNSKKTSYEISFCPDKNETKIKNANIKAKVVNTVDSNEPVEIRRMVLENEGNEEEILEVTSCFEPILSTKEQDYAHPSFNNLFLVYGYNKEANCITVKRRKRGENEKIIYLAASLYCQEDLVGDLEYEIDKEKFISRGNLGIPNMVKNSIPFSNKLGLATESIIALKRTVKIKPGEKINIDFVISVEENEEMAIKNIQKYNTGANVIKTFELAKAKVDTESRYLRLKGRDIANFQKIISYMIFQNPFKSINKIEKTKYYQKELWKYGISGDIPIILVKIKNVNDSYIVKEVLKAYEFFSLKNIKNEIVILDEEKYSYENFVREAIENAILNNHMGYLKNIQGGIFTLSSNEIDKKDLELLNYVASITIDSKLGGIENNLKEIEEKYLEKYKEISKEENIHLVSEEENEDINILENYQNLLYYNEFGAFSNDGKEYLITLNKNKRLPSVWCNILSNEKFGSMVTESMGGYTWYKNSRLNRVTAWENHTSYDIPSEAIYIKNTENNKTWSLGLNPMPDNKNYNIIHGFGYSKYIHKSQGIVQELKVFVPKEDSAKVQILTLKNTTPNRKTLKIYYYCKPVIGEDEIKTNNNINLEFDVNNNMIYATNIYETDLKNNLIYVSCSEKIKSYTGDKNFFLGKGGLSNPDSIQKICLNNENSLGKQACIAYEVEIELASFEEKEISIILGAEENIFESKNIAYKYSKIQKCNEELNKVKQYWEELLRKMSSKNSIRIYEHYSKWMVNLSNNKQ